MLRNGKSETVLAIQTAGLVPVFSTSNISAAKDVAEAVADANCPTLEFTNRAPGAAKVFAELADFCALKLPNMLLGAGSIVDPYTAAIYLNHGAQFIVGPTLCADTAKLCNLRGVPYSPGCGSPTEISEALRLGVEIVKIFPGDTVGGPAFVKAVLGPMPWGKNMITGGVKATPDSIREWIKSGATVLGIGSNLIRKDWIEAENFDAIKQLTANVLGWIREARP